MTRRVSESIETCVKQKKFEGIREDKEGKEVGWEICVDFVKSKGTEEPSTGGRKFTEEVVKEEILLTGLEGSR